MLSKEFSMQGGIIRGTRLWSKRLAAHAALTALLLASITSSRVAQADEANSMDDCVRQAPPEQSIVVASGKADQGDLPESADIGLEPIAVASDEVPDLA
jgi:hypothetical protein